jgi:hypothetical protein
MMTGFKGPDMDVGAQTFLQVSIGYFRDAFICELTRIDSPHFQVVQVYCIVPRQELVLEKVIVERMMGRGKSHSECQKKEMPPEAPSEDLQLGTVQSANQDVSVMLLQTHYGGGLTIPLKDATGPMHYLG